MKYSAVQLRLVIEQVMENAGCQKTEARQMADTVIFAEYRGVKEWGVNYFLRELKKIENGQIRVGTVPLLEKDNGTILKFDAGYGLGPVAGRYMEDACIERAKKQGVCIALGRNASSLGLGAYYTRYAAHKEVIGIMMERDGNHVSIGLPSGKRTSVLIDTCTEYPYSFLVELLCCCLGGEEDCCGFVAIDISKVTDYSRYLCLVDDRSDRMKTTIPLLPGEAQHISYGEKKQNGIELSESLERQLQAVRERYNIK